MTDQEEPVAAKPSLLPKILISGFITLVVIVETFIFFFLVPGADDVAALAEARLIENVQSNMASTGEEAQEDANSIREFELGEYGVSFTPPGADRNYRVEFRLFGTVKLRDEKQLERLFSERKGRFRDRMLSEVRNATMDELNEKQLGLIRRRILATSNGVLDDERPILLGVGFHEYQVYPE